MKPKSTPGIKAISVLLACIVAICCFTTACQPTPEEIIVTNKSDGKLEDTINSTSAPLKAVDNEPDRNHTSGVNMVGQGEWAKTLNGNMAVVNIDAEIKVPDVDAFPVYRMQYHKFMEEDVKKFVEVFFKDAEQVSNSSSFSKEEWEAMISDLRKQIERQKETGPDPDDHRPLDEVIAEMESQLTEYMMEYENALPLSEMGNKDIDYSFQDSVIDERQKEVNIKAIMQDGTIERLNVASFVGENNDQMRVDFTNTEGIIPVEELQKRAEQYASLLGIDATLVYTDESAEHEGGEIFQTSAHYEKAINGVPFYDIMTGSGPTGGEAISEEEMLARNTQYGEPISKELLVMYSDIQDQPILSFSWSTPWDVVSVENENVAILSADEAKEIFEKNIFLNLYTNAEFGERVVEIETVQLSYICMKVKDEVDSYRGIPVWDFIGYEYFDGVESAFDPKEQKCSMLTINAIDGSIVNRVLGY